MSAEEIFAHVVGPLVDEGETKLTPKLAVISTSDFPPYIAADTVAAVSVKNAKGEIRVAKAGAWEVVEPEDPHPDQAPGSEA